MPLDAAPSAVKTDYLPCPVQTSHASRGSGELTVLFGNVLEARMGMMPGIGNFSRLATKIVCRALISFQQRGRLVLGDRSVCFIDTNAWGEAAETVRIVRRLPTLAKAA